MRFLLLSVNFSPERIGIGKFNGEMAAWLSSRGHQVRVVTAPPHYPEWKIQGDFSAWRYRKEIRNGITIWRCPVWIPSQPSGLKRLIYLSFFAISCFPMMLRQLFWRPHIVMTIEPSLACAFPAWCLAVLSGGRSWLHIQDLEVDAAFDLEILKSRWLKGWAVRVELFLMKLFDGISTLSQKMKEKIVRKGIAPSKVILFPNWVNLEEIYPLDTFSSFRSELGIPADQITALYSGNLGLKQGLDLVIEAARDLPNIHFVFCGHGPSEKNLKNLAQNLTNVTFLPLQPQNKLNHLLNLADLHLLPQKENAADLVMPSKLTGMLASGRPVVATAHSGTQVWEIVRQCGRVVPPGDGGAFKKALVELASQSELRNQLGGLARRFALQHWSRDIVLNSFEKTLENFAKS